MLAIETRLRNKSRRHYHTTAISTNTGLVHQFVFVPNPVGAGTVVWAQPDTHQVYSVKRIGTLKKPESFLSMPSFSVHCLPDCCGEKQRPCLPALVEKWENGACCSDTKMTS